MAWLWKHDYIVCMHVYVCVRVLVCCTLCTVHATVYIYNAVASGLLEYLEFKVNFICTRLKTPFDNNNLRPLPLNSEKIKA